MITCRKNSPTKFYRTYILILLNFLGYDGPVEGLNRLRAKSWLEPLDGRSIDEHLITVAFEVGNTEVVERVPINPIVYVSPPTLWLSGPAGNLESFQ